LSQQALSLSLSLSVLHKTKRRERGEETGALAGKKKVARQKGCTKSQSEWMEASLSVPRKKLSPSPSFIVCARLLTFSLVSVCLCAGLWAGSGVLVGFLHRREIRPSQWGVLVSLPACLPAHIGHACLLPYTTPITSSDDPRVGPSGVVWCSSYSSRLSKACVLCIP
jgi:hypothetical protein